MDDIGVAMKINVKKDESKELNIEFETNDITIPDMIANELLANDDVEFAGVSKDHPEVGKPVLIIKSKNAKKDLLKALDGINATFSALKTQIAKKK